MPLMGTRRGRLFGRARVPVGDLDLMLMFAVGLGMVWAVVTLGFLLAYGLARSN